MACGVRQELAKLSEEIFLVVEQFRDLGIDFRFGELLGAGVATALGTFLVDFLLLLVGVQNLEETLVLFRLRVEAIFYLVYIRDGMVKFNWLVRSSTTDRGFRRRRLLLGLLLRLLRRMRNHLLGDHSMEILLLLTCNDARVGRDGVHGGAGIGGDCGASAAAGDGALAISAKVLRRLRNC